MPLISSEKILFLLSGGSSNSNPALSLGGQPSSTRVSGGMNGIFTDVSAEQAISGRTDYRCFYVKNASDSEYLYGSTIYIQSEVPGGSSVQIGVLKSSEVQTISFEGSLGSGSLVLRLAGIQFSSESSGTLESLANGIVSAMSSAGFSGVVATTSSSGSTGTISLSFLGAMDNRSWPLIELVQNGLSGDPSVSISRQSSGGPINTVAPTVATPEVPPFGVLFSQTSSSSRIELGSLGPNDTVPVWIKRTTAPDTPLKEFDGVTIRLSGDPFGPNTQNPSSSSTSSSQPNSSSSSIAGFFWTIQPSDSAWIGPVGEKYSEFSYAYGHIVTQYFTIDIEFQYSDDGAVWQEFSPEITASFGSMPDPVTGLAVQGEDFRVDSFVLGRRYRVKASASGEEFYSDSAFSVCPPMDCSDFWPVGWSEPSYYADCGLLPEPGFNKYMDCNACECAKVAISSSSSSSVDCSDFPFATAMCVDPGVPLPPYCNYDSFYDNGCLERRDCGVVVDGSCIRLDEYLSSINSSSASS